jgi:hypothetical protein
LVGKVRGQRHRNHLPADPLGCDAQRGAAVGPGGFRARSAAAGPAAPQVQPR